jgi:hypothetical protein
LTAPVVQIAEKPLLAKPWRNINGFCLHTPNDRPVMAGFRLLSGANHLLAFTNMLKFGRLPIVEMVNRSERGEYG